MPDFTAQMISLVGDKKGEGRKPFPSHTGF